MRSTVPSSVTSGPAGVGAESTGTRASGCDVDAYRVTPARRTARGSGASSPHQPGGLVAARAGGRMSAPGVLGERPPDEVLDGGTRRPKPLGQDLLRRGAPA